jgi:hypothetical protein
MKFKLGNTTVTAINDGGLNIECYCPPGFHLATWAVDSGQAIKPVLSFEVVISCFNFLSLLDKTKRR